MKIDAVLARHPWPWRITMPDSLEWWDLCDANEMLVFDDGSAGGKLGENMPSEIRDAILELVEAYVNAKEGKETKQ